MVQDWQTAPDSALIDGCLQGEEPAWNALITRYSRLIYSIPLRFGFPQTVADEVFQDTCLALLEGLGQLKNHGRLRSWLMTVCKRACIQRLRNKQKEPDDSMEEDWELQLTGNDPAIEQSLIKLEQEHLVYQALDMLEEPCKGLLTALFLTEPRPPYDIIAQQFDISKGSIGPYRSRCLKKLKVAITQLEHN